MVRARGGGDECGGCDDAVVDRQDARGISVISRSGRMQSQRRQGGGESTVARTGGAMGARVSEHQRRRRLFASRGRKFKGGKVDVASHKVP